MVLSLGRQPLLARNGVGMLPRLGHCRSRFYLIRRVHIRRLLDGLNGTVAGPSRRYTPCQVLAFKTESQLVKRGLTAIDSLAHVSRVVRYRFVVPQYVTTFGQTLRVVGSLPELGCWDPHRAPMMNWCEGHQWILECALPQQSFEFKITVFDGQGVRWEGGSNRVVHAADEEGDIPVEIVVWLTCHFNATTNTQLQLAVPRASIQDAYETGRATLEFLKLRQSKLGLDTEKVASSERRRQHSAELARLSGAVVEQRTLVHQLSDLLGQESGTTRVSEAWGERRGSASGGAPNNQTYTGDEDDEDRLLLLAIDSVRVPKLLRRIAFVQSWTPEHAAALPPADGAAASSDNGNGAPHHDRHLYNSRYHQQQQHHHHHHQQAVAVPTPPVPGHNPFLRGELDSRVEDLVSAAEALLLELKDLPQDAAVMEWANLAQEAGQAAMALQALGGDVDDGANDGGGDGKPSALITQMQMQGLASVDSALAGGISGSGAAMVREVEAGAPTAAGGVLAGSDEDTPMQVEGQIVSFQPWDLREGTAAGAGTGPATEEGEVETEGIASGVEVQTEDNGAKEDCSLAAAPLAATVSRPLATVATTNGGVGEAGASASCVAPSGALVLPDTEREILAASAAPAAAAAPKARPLQQLASSVQGQLKELGVLAVAMLAAMRGAVGLR